MKKRKKRAFDQVAKKNVLKRKIFTVQFLILGVIFLCFVLPQIQRRGDEARQQENSERILEEVVDTMKDNEDILVSSIYEFNSLNQSNLGTLAEALRRKNVMDGVTGKQDLIDRVPYFKTLQTQTGVNGLAIVNKTDFSIMISDDENKVLTDITTLGYSKEEMNSILVHSDEYIDEFDSQPRYKIDGTGDYSGEKTVFNPLIKDSEYIYSKYLSSDDNGGEYYLLARTSSAVLDRNNIGIKQVTSVISSVTVGHSGFVFAIDKNTNKFIYFNDGETDLSGEETAAHGLTSSALADGYSGYQEINGEEYFCVSKEYSEQSVGDLILFTAVVTETEIFTKNINSIVISNLTFILVALAIIGYGFILKNEYYTHVIDLSEKYSREIQSLAYDNDMQLTNFEVEERSLIKIKETIDNNQDPKLKRTLVGTRDLRGRQHFFSKYIGSRIIPTSVMGLLLILGVVFFAQTILSLNDVGIISLNRIANVSESVVTNDLKREYIQDYLNEQYLTKNKVITYLLEEEDSIFNYDVTDLDVHKIPIKDKDGNDTFLVHDSWGSKDDALERHGEDYQYAWGNNKFLQKLADENHITSIYVFNEEGHVIATNESTWNFKLSQNPEDQSYPFNKVINGELEYFVQPLTEAEVSGEPEQYLAYRYTYYTYYDKVDHRTKFATYKDFEQWTNYKNAGYKVPNDTGYNPELMGEIKQKRSMVQIALKEDTINHLLDSTDIGYLLSNMHIYGANSFYMVFDQSDDHKILYSPNEDAIGKKAADYGLGSHLFTYDSSYSGFEKMEGEDYFFTIQAVNDYFLAAVVQKDSLYTMRNKISLVTLAFAAAFVLATALCFTVSNDKAEMEEVFILKTKPYRHQNKSIINITTSVGTKKTTSAYSRYLQVAWKNKTPEQKLSSIILFYMTVISTIVVVAIIVSLQKGANSSVLSYIFSNKWKRGINIFALTESLIILLVALSLTKIITSIVNTFSKSLGARAETTASLVMAVFKSVTIIVAIFYSLFLFGFDTSSLLASAGIMSLVIGLGSQSLIGDLIAGIFIVFEGEFRVGDIVTIEGFRGTVLEIGLRTTKVIDTTNNIKIFNNRSISGVLNMTKETSVAKVNVPIEYKESLERVENIFKTEFPQIKKRNAQIIEGPIYKGVSSLGDNSVNLLIIALCDEKERMNVERILNREIYLVFNKHNITVPFPQVTLSYLDEINSNNQVTELEKKSARKFLLNETKEAEDEGGEENGQ